MTKLDSIGNNTEIEGNENNSESSLEKVNKITEEVHNYTDNIENKALSKEKLEAIDNNLSEKQKSAIGIEYLAYETMTISKITVIGYMLSDDEIKKEGAKKLALISIEELNKLTKDYM